MPARLHFSRYAENLQINRRPVYVSFSFNIFLFTNYSKIRCIKFAKKIYSVHLHGEMNIFSSSRASAVIKIVDNEAVIGIESGAAFVDCPIANRYAGLMHGIETA
jgi:hypothetical protein